MMYSRLQKYGAELIGTFSLVFAVSMSIAAPLPVPTPVVAGLTVGIFVYTFGSICGTVLNPAVTIALVAARKLDFVDALGYILVQFIGAFLAMNVVKFLMGSGVVVAGQASASVVIAEAIGAFILMTGISAVIFDRVKPAASGLTIGGSLLLGVLMAAGASNGILNPAVAFGLGSFNWAYVVGPVLGTLCGVGVYKVLLADCAGKGKRK